MIRPDDRPTRLLIIDDNPRDQRIYRRTLFGFDHTFAESGEEGLERLAGGGYDLVLLDYQLPTINGDLVLGKIRDDLDPELPVVVTGGGSEVLAVELLKQGATDYLSKDELHTPRVAQAIRDEEERVEVAYTLSNLDRLFRSSKHGMERVREIVANLRDFSRLDEADRKEINPNEALRATAEVVGYHVRGKGVALVVEPGDLPRLSCAPGKLNQVILNLTMNAIQAVSPGSTIRLASAFDRDGGELRLVVQDDGPGIPAAILSKIFDPFFTTKSVGSGTGLGLWIIDTFVREHGGRIEVHTTEGRGTTFSVVLPVGPTPPGDG